MGGGALTLGPLLSSSVGLVFFNVVSHWLEIGLKVKKKKKPHS